jgi:hypothetical protein
MRDSSRANFELSIVLPLGVVANQLMKVEADLRFLNAKRATYASEGLGREAAAQVAARLERINEALEAIRALVVDIETDVQPARTDRDD